MENNNDMSPEDVLAIQQMVHGEAAGADDDFKKVVTQSAMNRLNSGRKKEFGATVPEILKKGYYAVSNPNTPYKQAVSGKHPDMKSKVSWGNTKKIVESVIGDKDYGNGHQFYFTKDEMKKLIKKKGFDFKKVKRKGHSGKYILYGY